MGDLRLIQNFCAFMFWESLGKFNVFCFNSLIVRSTLAMQKFLSAFRNLPFSVQTLTFNYLDFFPTWFHAQETTFK